MEILVGFLVGSVGFGFAYYGKKQQKYVFLISGVIMMVYPYFVSNAIVSLLIGAVLVGATFYFKDVL